jgi:hypothetical protein
VRSSAEEPLKLVLDTSLFVNPDVRVSLGTTPTEAFITFLDLARRAPSLRFYMPPSIFEELMNFAQRDRIPAELLHHLTQKPPARYDLSTPGLFLYELVEEMRDRVNKGLRIAEQGVRAAASGRPVDDVIKETRRKYRDALREGVIDSKEDVDLVLLAYELRATLVSADLGALIWAGKLGIPWILPEKFREFVEARVEAV